MTNTTGIQSSERYLAIAIEAHHQRELISVLNTLSDRNVQSLLIKGTPLAYTHYAAPELRRRSDTDLLIRRRDLAAVEDVMSASGYVRLNAVEGEYVSHQCLYQKRVGNVAYNLDVHWKVCNPRIFAEVLTYDELLAGAVKVPQLGPHALTPGPVHALLIACVHRVAHHHSEIGRPEWFMDIRLLLERMTEIEKFRFAELAVRKQMRAVCMDALDKSLSMEIEPGRTPALFPDSALALLQGPEAQLEPSARYLDPKFRRFDAIRLDLSHLPFHGKVGFIRELLFPSPQYMLSKYTTSKRWLLPWLYLRRNLSGLRKLWS